ncbi:hypothetical protein BT96DRAFT_83464 [Gymnopus androsaceus JB14]|uniref:Uncharacterized protein n=1 Tax=Gymnopus androsaceus JB14 TaxID=1447944 RepID=A0A6A4IER2_9AGAR|nr:hypothetical protein BT96DRAFT_83464 [Gymnopus androsaceus JB14]
MRDNAGVFMSVLSAIIDIRRMTRNALTSTPPFKSLPMRISPISPIVLMFSVSLILPEIWIYEALTFGISGQLVFDN